MTWPQRQCTSRSNSSFPQGPCRRQHLLGNVPQFQQRCCNVKPTAPSSRPQRRMPRRERKLPPGIFLLLPLFIASFVIVELLRPSETQRLARSAAQNAGDAQRRAVLDATKVDSNDSQAASNSTTMEDEVRALMPQCAQDAGRAQSFVLLFMGHSGSTALISALQQHADVLVNGFEPLDHGAMAGDTPQALEYARAFFAAGHRQRRTAGFKLRPRHILAKPSAWAALFREHGTRVIWNYRANIFKQAVGHYPITYLNDTTAYEGLKVEESTNTVNPFAIHNSAAFHQLLSARWRGERLVEDALAALGADSCVLPISYELLLRSPARALLAMQHFLGLQVDPSIRALRAKATSDNLCQLITNWNQLCRDFFLCSRWRAMMDDAENGCTCPVPTGVTQVQARRFCEPTAKDAPSKR